MRIDSSGNIGIGTTSNLLPNSTRTTLSINNTGSAAVAFGSNGTREGHIYVDNDEMEISATDNYMYFTAGSSERMRIDTSGRLLVGHTSLTGDSDSAYSRVVVNGNTQATSKGGILSLENTAASIGSVTNNSQIGQLYFKAETGEEFGLIMVEAEADATSSSCPGRIIFSTTASSETTPTERMRITREGKVGIGHTSPQFGLTLAQSSNNSGAIGWEDGGSTKRASIRCETSGDSLMFATGSSDTERMRIDSTGSVGIGVSNPGSYHADANDLVLASGMTIANTTQGHIFFADIPRVRVNMLDKLTTIIPMIVLTLLSITLRVSELERLVVLKTIQPQLTLMFQIADPLAILMNLFMLVMALPL